MYLLYKRHSAMRGQLRQGTLYRVHFQPNEKGDYNMHLIFISNVYELDGSNHLPSPLIHSASMVQYNGYRRLAFGAFLKRAFLHLIDRDARERFFDELVPDNELRIEVTEESQTIINLYPSTPAGGKA